MENLLWHYKEFSELDLIELYQILKLRSAVFVVEQNCPYLDTDDKDLNAYHLCGWQDKKLVAYARILPPGISYKEASIGRVVTHPDYRSKGAGKELMERAIENTLSQFHVSTIRIGAQLYLQRFYQSLLFINEGEIYLEDGIPHIEMVFTK